MNPPRPWVTMAALRRCEKLAPGVGHDASTRRPGLRAGTHTPCPQGEHTDGKYLVTDWRRGVWVPAFAGTTIYPRPTNGILLAITVMNSTLASSGRLAM